MCVSVCECASVSWFYNLMHGPQKQILVFFVWKFYWPRLLGCYDLLCYTIHFSWGTIYIYIYPHNWLNLLIWHANIFYWETLDTNHRNVSNLYILKRELIFKEPHELIILSLIWCFYIFHSARYRNKTAVDNRTCRVVSGIDWLSKFLFHWLGRSIYSIERIHWFRPFHNLKKECTFHRGFILRVRLRN